MPNPKNVSYVRRYAEKRRAAGDRSTSVRLDKRLIDELDRARRDMPRAAFVRALITEFVNWCWSGGIEAFPEHLTRQDIGRAPSRTISLWLDQDTLFDLDLVRGTTRPTSLIRYLIHLGIQWQRSTPNQSFPAYLARQDFRSEATREISSTLKGEAIGLKEIRQPGNDP